MCLVLLDQLIALDRAAGAYPDAIERARQRIDLEPLEEVGYRSLLQVQALAGDRAAAVQTYHRCVSVLERELGVGPDPATTAEYERLAEPGQVDRPRPGSARPGTGCRSRPRTAGRAELPAANPVRLVGRERGVPAAAAALAASAGRAGRLRRAVRRGRASGRPGCSTSCRPRCGETGSRPCGRAASPPGDGWRWPRCPSGCAARRCNRRGPGWSRSGRAKWTGWSRRGAPGQRPAAADGGRLAAAPVLRGAGPRGAVDRPARAAGPRRSAVVRRGHAGLAAVAAAPGPGPAAAGAWPRPGATRWRPTPSSARCCGCCARRAR